jgi:CDP-diacylglycerol--glycerol-3-phosphate 3-phosphatidyltransferase
VATETFGPSALATPANAVTVGRLAATPLLLALVLRDPTSWATLAAWVVLAGTDGVDGYLARRHGTTRSGAFLDPLADKCLVIGAMAALVVKHVFWWLPVALIGAREIAVSAYRSVVGRHGVSVPARFGGKVKAVVQDIAVGFALLPVGNTDTVADALLWAGVALALYTGGQYLLDARAGRTAERAV